MKLYVSDIDGTLLNSNSELSKFTVETINNLIDQGLHFTIATGRSFETAQHFLGKLNLKYPVVLFDGAVIQDSISGKKLHTAFLSRDLAKKTLEKYDEFGVSPLVYTFNENSENKIYYKHIDNKAIENYINLCVSKGDRRFTRVSSYEKVLKENIVTINMIEKPEILKRIAEDLRKNATTEKVFYVDSIDDSSYKFLMIMNKDAEKGKGIEFIKEYVGATHLVSFGDQLNDLSMFEISDESYATQNAQEAVKQSSTAVIGSNDEDAVAKFLEKEMEEKEGH
jgi:Cof subfamily protein (haloacid dehalogenase superfamily)